MFGIENVIFTFVDCSIALCIKVTTVQWCPSQPRHHTIS